MLEITDCKLCGERVLPGSQGKCPSCGCNVNDHSSDGLVPLKIHERNRNRMPCVCMLCGGNTDEVTDYTKSRYDGGDAPLWLVFLRNPIKALLLVNMNRSKVTVTLPIHRSCYLSTKLIPVNVHYDLNYIQFRVSPKLKKEYDSIC